MQRRYPFEGKEFEAIGLSLSASGSYLPGDPGRLTGPPEKCYPPEGAEVEILTLICGDKDALFLLDSTYDQEIQAALIEALESEGGNDD
jgi:hypothetical protein